MSGPSLAHMFFSDSYETATSRFTTLAEAANARRLSAPIPQSDHAIELALLGDVRANTLIIHSSGVHGVEGYVGSAIQLAILEARPRVPDSVAVLLIHVVNPSGMSLGRRWTANNVDLNRNFFETAPNPDPDPLYQRIDAFLNPQRESALKGFLPKALLLIARYGYNALQQAVAQGQFHAPKGLFYGGRDPEPETQTLLAAIRALHLQPQVVMGLDVHAGLGHFGEHQLLLEPFYFQEQVAVLHHVLDHDIISVSPGSSSTYVIKGGFIAGMKALFEPAATTYWLTEEFGTLGPMRLLKALRAENYYYQFEPGSAKWKQAAHTVKSAFCPEDDGWRTRAVETGTTMFKRLLRGHFPASTA
jgi:hypothetical protein